jgi:flagellin
LEVNLVLRLTSQYENKVFENRRYKINEKLQKAIRNTSSGIKVHSSADDPAGLAISETTRAQIRGLGQSQRNIQDSMSLLKTAEDGLMKTNEDVQRLYELSLSALNDTMNDKSREEAQVEVNQLLSSIEQTANSVQFNTSNLLSKGLDAKKIKIQLGSGANESMTVELMDITLQKLGLSNASIEPRENANKLLNTTKDVITTITGHLTRIGSQYSALEKNMENSLTLQNNLTTIESNIRDSNIGKEVIELAIDKILSEVNLSLHNYTDDQKQNFEKILFEK